MSIPRRRLHSQLLARNPARAPRDVVAHFGAVQAQDYLGALWAVGLRMRDAVESDVEHAIAEREIVRCWPMRGTLHFVAAEDVRWMLDLLAPRVLARHKPRLEREFELDAQTLKRSRGVIERALHGGKALTRPEIYALLEKARISTRGSRGLHILFTLAHERVICFGARRGKQPSFVLLDQWVPAAKPKAREEALAELARRYFTSHGPATLADFVWWSGLTIKDANEACSLAGPIANTPRAAKGTVHLLPPFDEYTVAYKGRADIIDPAFAKRVNAGGGMLNAVVVIDGIVAGTWKRTLRGDAVEIALSLFRELNRREVRALDEEAARYATFLGKSSWRTMPAP
jgi:Winged helix DNA-binding domain